MKGHNRVPPLYIDEEAGNRLEMNEQLVVQAHPQIRLLSDKDGQTEIREKGRLNEQPI